MDQKLMNTQDTLLAYSEWLDSEGLIEGGDHDDRSHEDLVEQFVEHWESNPDRATLAGRALAKITDALREVGQKISDALSDL